MWTPTCPVLPSRRWAVVACMALAICLASSAISQAQRNDNFIGAVGGIMIDAEGVLNSASVDQLGRLRTVRAEMLQQVPESLQQPGLVRVSLRKLEAAIRRHLESGEALPDAVQYLAGLQQIQYVLVYPEEQDIVLVGPGEPWKVGPQGAVVGATSGRPVMLLDDLAIALRTARQAAQGGISVSIDPTEEGLQRLRQFASGLKTIGNPQSTAGGVEQSLGMQTISINNVPATSHFARVLVAADYRMKRIAMGFEPSPVQGLPSFLSMISGGPRGMSNMLPRWWLQPEYEPVLRDGQGQAFELRGGRVKTMTEEDFLNAAGNREHTGKASPLAQRWADLMTDKYAELSVADPIFGQLRNCMELSIVAALIVRENLPEKAGFDMPTLLDPNAVEAQQFPAPRAVPSKASVMKKGRNWVITASGGVLLNSWQIAANVVESSEPAQARARLKPEGDAWYQK